PVGGGGGGSPTTTIAPGPTDRPIVRVAGNNRMQTARLLSQLAFPDGADVVYIATARDYADALSAGPGAVSEPGPVLLTPVHSLDVDTAAELARLGPSRIVVMGGWAAVSDEVFELLRPYASREIVRIAGVDRFGTAAELSKDKFPNGASTVYLATGRSYPDALAGGLGASVQGSPVLLTEAEKLPAVTAEELQRLAPERIIIIGGTGAVSRGIEALMADYAGTIERIAGPDRYATTAEVGSRVTAEGTDTVFVVTGTDFADALTGIPIAAITQSSVLMVGPAPLHPSVIAELQRLQPRIIVVLGGTAAVSEEIERLLEPYMADGTGERVRGMQITPADVEAARAAQRR
ncbi:MAG TPA: cell wall-binding repeat-containing protein, partial [Acidimicrobiales bacterium]|nr:cell wall-binding repeat-containing protein [Acidimicrobiales bacterium]